MGHQLFIKSVECFILHSPVTLFIHLSFIYIRETIEGGPSFTILSQSQKKRHCILYVVVSLCATTPTSLIVPHNYNYTKRFRTVGKYGLSWTIFAFMFDVFLLQVEMRHMTSLSYDICHGHGLQLWTTSTYACTVCLLYALFANTLLVN